MTYRRFPAGVLAEGQICWCGTQFLAAHIITSTVDGTVHGRGWCSRIVGGAA